MGLPQRQVFYLPLTMGQEHYNSQYLFPTMFTRNSKMSLLPWIQNVSLQCPDTLRGSFLWLRAGPQQASTVQNVDAFPVISTIRVQPAQPSSPTASAPPTLVGKPNHFLVSGSDLQPQQRNNPKQSILWKDCILPPPQKMWFLNNPQRKMGKNKRMLSYYTMLNFVRYEIRKILIKISFN